MVEEINFENLAKNFGVETNFIKNIYDKSLTEVALWTEDEEERQKMALRKTVSLIQRKKLSGATTKEIIVLGHNEPKDFIALMKISTDKKIKDKGKDWAVQNNYLTADGVYLNYTTGRNLGKPLVGDRWSVNAVALSITEKKIISLSANNKDRVEKLLSAMNNVAIAEVVASQKNPNEFYLNDITEIKKDVKVPDELINEAIKNYTKIDDDKIFDYLQSNETRSAFIEGMIIDFTIGTKVGIRMQIPNHFEETLRIWVDYNEATDMLAKDIPIKVLINKAKYDVERKEFIANSNFVWSDPKYRIIIENNQKDVEGAWVD